MTNESMRIRTKAAKEKYGLVMVRIGETLGCRDKAIMSRWLAGDSNLSDKRLRDLADLLDKFDEGASYLEAFQFKRGK